MLQPHLCDCAHDCAQLCYGHISQSIGTQSMLWVSIWCRMAYLLIILYLQEQTIMLQPQLCASAQLCFGHI